MDFVNSLAFLPVFLTRHLEMPSLDFLHCSDLCQNQPEMKYSCCLTSPRVPEFGKFLLVESAQGGGGEGGTPGNS